MALLIFLAQEKKRILLQVFDLLFGLSKVSFLNLTLSLITKVIFILFSVSSNLEFRSVSHTFIYENSELKVFKNLTFLGAISDNGENDLFGKKCIQFS